MLLYFSFGATGRSILTITTFESFGFGYMEREGVPSLIVDAGGFFTVFEPLARS